MRLLVMFYSPQSLFPAHTMLMMRWFTVQGEQVFNYAALLPCTCAGVSVCLYIRGQLFSAS